MLSITYTTLHLKCWTLQVSFRSSCRLFARRMHTYSLQWEIGSNERLVVSLLSKALCESEGDSVRNYLAHHPRAHVTKLAPFTDTLTKIEEIGIRSSKASKLGSLIIFVSFRKLSIYAVTDIIDTKTF